MAPPSPPLIRGYLPVRVSFPDDHGDSFLFVKAHSGGGKGGSAALFVANASRLPGVRTRIFLRSLFERYGDVERVTVVRNPRSSASTSGGGGGAILSSSSEADNGERTFAELSAQFANPRLPPLLNDPHDEGKFAHVVFASPKHLGRALRGLRKAATAGMGHGVDDDDDDCAEDVDPAAVRFGPLEVRELRDQSERALRAEKAGPGVGRDGGGGGDDDDDSDGNEEKGGESNERATNDPPNGLDALVERHRSSFVPRSDLLEACNAVMAQYERAEEEAERLAQVAREGPDEDGFITVTHGPSVKQDLEEDDGDGARGVSGRRKAGKRSRGKKKGVGGASELKDFYRFQMKENRKRSLQELRKRFEEDLAKVKKMKEDKNYRPF